jgi:hypothetical protein
VVDETRRHLETPQQGHALDVFLLSSHALVLGPPGSEDIAANLDLVRSAKDVPIGLSLLAGDVDVFVTNDRDFTDPGATAPRFHERVRIMLAAVFLRDVVGLSSEALEDIRKRPM